MVKSQPPTTDTPPNTPTDSAPDSTVDPSSGSPPTGTQSNKPKPRARFNWGRLTRSRWLNLWVCSGLLILSGGVGTAVWGVRQINKIDRSLPDPTEITTFARPGTLTIMAADGTILQQLGPVTYEKLSLSDIPDGLAEAFLAAEDHRFYDHHGVDFQGILRAAIVNFQAGELVEGASTITQQLARMVFLTQDPTFTRKIREARLAQKIEQELVKKDILEYYLNLVYLGSGAYGVADAAWVYFSKTVNQLTLPEMALIAGMPAAPSEYSPLVNPDIARDRRNTILGRMAEAGYISPEAAKTAQASDLNLNPNVPKRLNVRLPYFTSYIQQELPKYLTPEQIEQGGLVVQTTLDMKAQNHAEQVVQNALETYGQWEGFENAALVSLDPRSGEIRAMVGGSNFKDNQFNFATQAKRQPGSTFKGLIYTAAIASGMSPYDSYEDRPIKFGGYEPKNANGRNVGWVSLTNALTNSINTVAIQVLADVGFEPTIALARDMGIESDLGEVYPLALGAYEVTLLEMVGAYGTLANAGKHHKPHGIRKILNTADEVLYDYSTSGKPKQAVDADTAAIVTWMLQQVVSSGTGVSAALPDRPVAGKTGTTDEARDLWFIGYIPQLVTGVWLGNKDNQRTYGTSATAATIWHDFMVEATKGMEVVQFPELPDLNNREPSIERQPVGEKPQQGTGSSNTTQDSSGTESGGGSYETWEAEPGATYQDSGNTTNYNDNYYAPPSDPAPAADYSGDGGGSGEYYEPAPAPVEVAPEPIEPPLPPVYEPEPVAPPPAELPLPLPESQPAAGTSE